MAKELTKKEKARTKTDFDPPKKTGRFSEKVGQLAEQRAAAEAAGTKTNIVSEMTKSAARKSEHMTVKMTPEVFKDFRAINEARGMSNSSAMNMLITHTSEKIVS